MRTTTKRSLQTSGLALDPLAVPSKPVKNRRKLFSPRRGWFRRVERGLNNFLSAKVFPKIPGIASVYSHNLDRRFRVSHSQIPIRSLPPAFDGLRILLLSDLHMGPFLRPSALEKSIQRMMALEPDLVVLAGDLVTARLEDLDGFERSFEAFRAAPMGTFVVMGNHEHYTGELDRLRERFNGFGFQLLENSSYKLEREGAEISIAGIDDWLVGQPDLAGAMRDISRPIVLLSHNPDVLFDAAERGVDLILSGHTHAGQIRIPKLPVLVRQSRFRLDEGRYRYSGSELVVSRGFGVSGLPLRIACPPEVVLLELIPSSLSRNPENSVP